MSRNYKKLLGKLHEQQNLIELWLNRITDGAGVCERGKGKMKFQKQKLIHESTVEDFLTWQVTSPELHHCLRLQSLKGGGDDAFFLGKTFSVTIQENLRRVDDHKPDLQGF